MTDIVQLEINLFPIKEVEVDGIQMGVLSDGTPYLTARGLARMCGVDHAVILRLANNWDEERFRPRGKKILELLAAQKHAGDHLYKRTQGNSGETHAYVDAVCMAVLEYYAFEATQGNNEIAIRNFRLLARYSFRQFIYRGVGYDPEKSIPDSWKNFHERVLLNDTVPPNYFSVFREIADLMIPMIRAGLPLDEHTVPDGSVGNHWSRHWCANGLTEKFGDRKRHPHFYPDWFPQAAANPIEAWIYPIQALGDFREWLYEVYVPEQFPGYVSRKVKAGAFIPDKAVKLIEVVSRKPKELGAASAD